MTRWIWRTALATVLVSVLGVSGASTAANALANSNDHLYWNAAGESVAAYSTIEIEVLFEPNTEASPTTVSSETYYISNECGSCIEFNAPAPLNLFGYWFGQSYWSEFKGITYPGTVGFVVDMTNGT